MIQQNAINHPPDPMEIKQTSSVPKETYSSYISPDSQFPPRKSTFKSRRNTIISLVSLIVLVLASVVAFTLSLTNQDVRSRASLSGPTISLIPSTKTGKPGDIIRVGVMMNTSGDNVSAADITITYDSVNMEIVNFSAGTALPLVLSSEKHINGQSNFALGINPPIPFTSSGVIGTYTIKLLTSSPSSIGFSSQSQVSVIGKSSNVLVSATGTSINIASPSEATTTMQFAPSSTVTQPSEGMRLSIDTNSLPEGKEKIAYNTNIKISKTKGSGNPSVTITGLPFGVFQNECQESSDETQVICVISGTPIRSGIYSVGVSVVGENNKPVGKYFSLIVK